MTDLSFDIVPLTHWGSLAFSIAVPGHCSTTSLNPLGRSCAKRALLGIVGSSRERQFDVRND